MDGLNMMKFEVDTSVVKFEDLRIGESFTTDLNDFCIKTSETEFACDTGIEVLYSDDPVKKLTQQKTFDDVHVGVCFTIDDRKYIKYNQECAYEVEYFPPIVGIHPSINVREKTI